MPVNPVINVRVHINAWADNDNRITCTVTHGIKQTCPLTQRRPLVVHICKLLHGNHDNDIISYLDIGQCICISSLVPLLSSM